MPNIKHTSGPWVALPWDEMAGYDCITPGIHIEANKPDGRRIVTVDAANYGWNRTGLGNGAQLNREESRARVIADAQLIAAAPELLEAAQNASNVLAALATGQLKTVSRNSAALVQLRAAITKAKGKA